MAAYWAVTGSGQNKQFELAHRSGLGCVVLMHTTDASLGPGCISLITQYQKEAKVHYFSDADPDIPYIQTRTIMLTESQRTPDFFCSKSFG